MKFITTLSFVFVPLMFFAQTLTPTWDSTYTSEYGQKINDIILMADGRLAIVGETRLSNKREGLFMIVDSKTGEAYNQVQKTPH